MTTYKPFSIIVIPYPFTDSSHIKKRPALVLSSELHQKYTGHITLMMITSAKHSHWYGDYRITDLKSTGLQADSIVRQKIFTLDIRLVIDDLGKLATKDKKAVMKHIHQHLPL